MKIYVKRVGASGWASATEWAWQERPSITVFDSGSGAVDTGLLWEDGTKIYAAPGREPIGFRPRPRADGGQA